MNGLHIVFVFIASAILASFTDWYFFGVLFHARYGLTPGVWKKYRDKRDAMTSIGISEGIMSIRSLVFILVCGGLGFVSSASTLLAAVALSVMIPVPLLITNAIYIPMDRSIVVSHSLGWPARLVFTALCEGKCWYAKSSSDIPS
jgi:hypothetical protein